MRSPWSSNGSTGSFLFLFLPVIYKGRPLVRLVKVMGFSVVMYGYKSWTIKKVKWSEMAQSCPTLCDPMDCSLPGSSVPGILQAGILEWVALSFSRRSSQPRDRTWVSRIAGRRFTIWVTREVLSAKELILLNCNVGEVSWESLGLQGDPTSSS